MIIVIKEELMVMVPSWIVIALCTTGAFAMLVNAMLNIEKIRQHKREAKIREGKT